jgi:hypothetical protein
MQELDAGSPSAIGARAVERARQNYGRKMGINKRNANCFPKAEISVILYPLAGPDSPRRPWLGERMAWNA